MVAHVVFPSFSVESIQVVSGCQLTHVLKLILLSALFLVRMLARSVLFSTILIFVVFAVGVGDLSKLVVAVQDLQMRQQPEHRYFIVTQLSHRVLLKVQALQIPEFTQWLEVCHSLELVLLQFERSQSLCVLA